MGGGKWCGLIHLNKSHFWNGLVWPPVVQQMTSLFRWAIQLRMGEPGTKDAIIDEISTLYLHFFHCLLGLGGNMLLTHPRNALILKIAPDSQCHSRRKQSYEKPPFLRNCAGHPPSLVVWFRTPAIITTRRCTKSTGES